MPKKREKRDVDAEIDLHGLNVEQSLHALQRRWPEWRGMVRVRIIHGQGAALKPAVQRWCEEMGVPYAPDPGNPGAVRMFPGQRVIPDLPIGTTLAEKGLRLTPEQEAELRDPEAAARLRRAEEQRRQEEARKRRAAELAAADQRRRDDALWQAEVARLDKLDRLRKPGSSSDVKPVAPRVLPPSEIRYEEGYWRGELVRVADTDTDTLKKQKRTGLDKLAPPLEEKPPAPAPQEPAKRRKPERDFAADQALFEAELARLDRQP